MRSLATATVRLGFATIHPEQGAACVERRDDSGTKRGENTTARPLRYLART
jgi:hypothetical protein